MIRLDLARDLLAAGVLWTPAAGDRFVVPDREMDDDVFVISEMTVDVHDFVDGRVIGFNGTTEWALDSVSLTEVLWLPREDQLRELLGDRFTTLTRNGDGTWTVALGEHTFTDADPENAYGEAVLWVANGHA